MAIQPLPEAIARGFGFPNQGDHLSPTCSTIALDKPSR